MQLIFLVNCPPFVYNFQCFIKTPFIIYKLVFLYCVVEDQEGSTTFLPVC